MSTAALERFQRRIAASLDPAVVLDGVTRETEDSAEAGRCSANFLYWLENYGWLADPKAKNPEDREFPFKPWPEQRKAALWLLEGYHEGHEQVLNKAREIGATWLAMHLVWWLWRFERGFSALLVSRKEELVDDGGDPRISPASVDSLFGKIDFIHRHQPPFLRPLTYRRHRRLRNRDNGSKIAGETTSDSLGRSTRHSLVVIDEAAAIETRKQKAIRLSLESVSDCRWWISTPKGRSNAFGFMVVVYAGRPEHYLELGWRTDPRKTDKWFRSLLVENGGRLTWDQRAQEYDCSLAGVSGARVWKAPAGAQLYEDADLPELARTRLFLVAPMDFGTGPSWTVCLWILVAWDESPHPVLPLLFVDCERVWERTPAHEIGAEMIETHREGGYGDNHFYTGDPAGIAAESDQGSWESRLRDAGVPISCLPGEYNTADILHVAGIDEVQALLDSGLLRIHRTRCPIVRQAVESWEWDIPEGIEPEHLSREILKPRKDGWSHLGQALVYGVAWVMRNGRQAEDQYGELARALPKGGAVLIGDLLSKLTRRK